MKPVLKGSLKLFSYHELQALKWFYGFLSRAITQPPKRLLALQAKACVHLSGQCPALQGQQGMHSSCYGMHLVRCRTCMGINSMQNAEGMGVLGCFVKHESLQSKKKVMTKKHTFFKVQPCMKAEGSVLYQCALINAP